MKIKKICASFLIGAMMLSLAACSGSTKKIESPADFEGAKDMLESAGNPQRHDGYDLESWQALRAEVERFVTWLNAQHETTNDAKGVYGE